VVETEQALTNAFAAALKSSGATLIAARIDASGYVAQFNALWEL
jgi:acetolactate synthase I/II/III large subunit